MPKPRQTRAETERAIFLGDWHHPYHDEAAVELALAFTAWFKPHAVFILGDFLDFYEVSRFDKDPARLLDLQDDLDQGKRTLRRLRKAAPDAKIRYLDGNHEHRLVKYVWEHPEISPLDCLKLPSLLGLAELGISHHGYHEQLRWHGLLVEHGNRANKLSAYTARAMLEARGVSGVSGHTHRLGTHYRTDFAGQRVWAENGCLCNLRPEYVIGLPDWQHGFSVARAVRGKDRFILESVPIVGHALYYNDHLWQ